MPNGETLRVREVWADNLDTEMALIRDVVEQYPYVAMDTEFPGVVARPVGNFKSSREYHYRALKLNVDMLKCVQLMHACHEQPACSLQPDPGHVCTPCCSRACRLIQV